MVLACDNMTAGKGRQEFDGPATTLYERFLWRLFGKDYALYERYQPYYADKSKIVERLRQSADLSSSSSTRSWTISGSCPAAT